MAALRDCIKKSDKEAVAELHALYLTNQFKRGDNLYKVLPTQGDRETYKSIITAKSTKDITKAGKIYKHHKSFDKKLKKPNIEDIDAFEYNKFKTICLERLTKK